MEEISLIGKVVKVNSVDDLRFYYPTFQVKSFLSSIDYGIDVIYTGPMNKRATTILQSCNYIATQGLYSYDLTDRKAKVAFVFSRYGREPSKSILDCIDFYDEEEFNYCCKVYWTCARWPYKPEHEVSIYQLYQASVESVTEFIKKFLEVRKVYPIGVVEQSFFTFMLRSKSVDEQNVSPVYKRLLKSFYNISGQRFRSAIMTYIDSKLTDRDLRFIEFIYALRG